VREASGTINLEEWEEDMNWLAGIAGYAVAIWLFLRFIRFCSKPTPKPECPNCSMPWTVDSETFGCWNCGYVNEAKPGDK
jgi:hypothetical protein